jgi:hypothetical protein
VEGAAARARRLIEGINVQLEEVTTALDTLGQSTSPQAVTATGTFSLAPMGLAGRGSMTHLQQGGGAAMLSGAGTLSVSRVDVATAVNELRVISEPDVDKLATRAPATWSKQQLILVAVLVIIDVYLILPPTAQQHLLIGANLLQGVEAIVALLLRS